MLVLSVLTFLCLVINSFEKSTPQDTHYVGAVVEYHRLTNNVQNNTARYVSLIQEAASQNADIVVFPELTLTNAHYTFEVPINGLVKEQPVPALYPSGYDEVITAISQAALDNQIYVVINGRESMDCTLEDTRAVEYCPEEKAYVFNTNVVFDRNGAIIDRYRKINLFGEVAHTPALKPDLGKFTTDFGVTFGHFVCFDLMFQVPAVQVVQKENIKNIVYPTMWFSEMPYFTAVQIQEAYAYSLDVNFLGAGANNVRVGSAGSGIYSGKAGALISTMPGVSDTRLLVARVPKVPGQITEPFPGPVYDNPKSHDGLKLNIDTTLTSHNSRLLVPGSQEFTLENGDVSCTFRVRLSSTPGEEAVKYRAFVQDNTNTYARREIGLVACLLTACETDNVTTCPHRYSKDNENPIQELEIDMKTYRNEYNTSLHCNNIQYFGLSFGNNHFPLSPKNYTFTMSAKDKCESASSNQNSISAFQKEIISKNKREKINYKLETPQSDLVAFGVLGRLYVRDVDHNLEATAEDLQQYYTLLDEIYGLSDY
ncbi:vanin-like protein 3 [Trichoplusia ni]|uniref:Vanin-like protein 3 n=1 Tax=Trichoplusia ni TaxID=7111 RepID=A0A7E5WJL4_TRINI|nr:vanin-like protein 3 [Trichoplusia ni]